MNQVERRGDDCDALLPEVLALLKSCGEQIRNSDSAAVENALVHRPHPKAARMCNEHATSRRLAVLAFFHAFTRGKPSSPTGSFQRDPA